MNQSDNVTGPPAPETTTRAELLRFLEAVEEEMRGLRKQCWDLSARLGRYDQMFEEAFQREAAARLNPNKGYGELQAQCESPLSRLGRELRDVDSSAKTGRIGLR